MAKRFSGDLQINVVYDRGDYRTSVSRGGKVLWRGRINPAPAGFGRGVAYDSAQAYDEIAESALSFADSDLGHGDISDHAESSEDGWKVRRVPRYWEQYPGGRIKPKKFATRDANKPGIARRAGRAYGKTKEAARSAKAKWTKAVADARVAYANAKTSTARTRAKAEIAYANAKLRATRAYDKAKASVDRTGRKSRAALGAWSAQNDPERHWYGGWFKTEAGAERAKNKRLADRVRGPIRLKVVPVKGKWRIAWKPFAQ